MRSQGLRALLKLQEDLLQRLWKQSSCLPCQETVSRVRPVTDWPLCIPGRTAALLGKPPEPADLAGRGLGKNAWCGVPSLRYASTSSEGSAGSGSAAVEEVAKGSPGGAATVERRRRRGPVSWASLALLLLTGGGLVAYYDQEKKRRLKVLNKTASVGRASIGGPFTLVDQDGKTVTEKDLTGSWNLLYFGFTYCPDICPDELQKMAAAIDAVKTKSGLRVRPVFISVDPARDTPEQMRSYIKEFHLDMIGLTGSEDAVAAAARAYRVYYMKTQEDADDYLVDHSIIMYLMDPKMDFVKFFGKNYTADGLASEIVEHVKAWEV